MSFQSILQKKKSQFQGYMSNEINRYQFFSLLIFIGIITALAWQSDDAYHAYVMAKNLVLGNGFVYNVGERASATSCPLFTLVIACGYFFIRKMFIVSLLICILFSASAYFIIMKNFCKTKKQVVCMFLALIGSSCFISYTTSGLENCLLFFLTALFLKYYFATETYRTKQLLQLAVLVALIAMTRMDAVLLVVPMVVYAFLAKREKVSFIKAVGIGFAGLLPFIIWELFSVLYYGFFVPNTAFVKLGTSIPLREYLIRGIQYFLTSAFCDLLLIAVPLAVLFITFLVKKARYLYCSAGIILYFAYVFYIGGDFMLGRHFTVLFFMSVVCFLQMQNDSFGGYAGKLKFEKIAVAVLAAGLIYTGTTRVITTQFVFGENFSSPISDERSSYFRFTSLFNNAASYAGTGEMVIRDAWNEEGIDEYRNAGYRGGILRMVPGISIYYNSDMYLNDLYALGDPFLSKLPAVREEGWRIGHMWRESPAGYNDTVLLGENVIENEDLHQYYEIIKLITRGDIWDKERLQAIIDINTGKYDYMIENYKRTLDENCRQIVNE